jgi:ABC-type transporter Mla subunit MlaD
VIPPAVSRSSTELRQQTALLERLVGKLGESNKQATDTNAQLRELRAEIAKTSKDLNAALMNLIPLLLPGRK